jgi:hypothetical protein
MYVKLCVCAIAFVLAYYLFGKLFSTTKQSKKTINRFAPDPMELFPLIKKYQSINTIEDNSPTSMTDGLSQKRIGNIVKHQYPQYQQYSDDLIGLIVVNHLMNSLPVCIVDEFEMISKSLSDPLGIRNELKQKRY